MAAQIIRFPTRPPAKPLKAGAVPRKAPDFQEAARLRLKAVIAHALAVLDSLEQEAS
jgi:hypothetical protein